MTRYVVVARDIQTVVGPFANYTLAQRWAEAHRTHMGTMPHRDRQYTGWIIKQLRRPDEAAPAEVPGVV